MRTDFRVNDDMRSDDPIVAAQAYIDAGMKLVVIHGILDNGECSCRKPDCGHKGKHPIAKFFPQGALSATDDLGLIKKAFVTYPDANLATVLAGVTVLDIDGPLGKATFDQWDTPKTIKVKTSRGIHAYFLGENPNGTQKAKQLDILTGAKRYVMVPPSIHESGHHYRWMQTSSNKLARLPANVRAISNEPTTSRSLRIGNRMIRKGERNDVLFRTACAIRRRIKDDKILLEMMQILNSTGLEEPLPDSELRSIIASSGKYGETSEKLFGPPLETEPLPMEYLWYPYIPRYGLTIIAGDPGRGKSMLTALLAATVTSGKKWPMANERPSGKKVLILSAEDNWARVTLHRLIKAGADISNIHHMYKFRALTNERLEILADYMQTERPDLVIIDTLSAYMGGGRDMHRQNEVGEFLGMLTEISEATGSAIVGLAHLNKQSNELPMYRIVGSIGFLASIRSALFLGADPDDKSRLALAQGKANASEKGKTIIFEMVGGGRADVPVLVPFGFSEATEKDVCRVDNNPVGRPNTEKEAAISFVLEQLSDEPIPWRTIQLSATARAIASEGTLNIVRAELSKTGQIVQIGHGKRALWKLGIPKVDIDQSI